jgi:hypothetical protein
MIAREQLWITPQRLAKEANISRRAATAALHRAIGGRRWRDCDLSVRLVRSRGGNRGQGYEVDVASLPPALRIKFGQQAESNILPAPTAPNLTFDLDSDDWQRRLAWLKPALAARQEGRPVGRSLREVAGTDGAPSFETLKRWLASYTKHGVAGLQRRRRADAAKSKVMISTEWYAATRDLPLEKRREIVAEIERHVVSLYAAGAPSRRQVAQLATGKLVELTRAAGVEMTDAAALRICQVPEHFARRGQGYQIVAIKRRDAKQFFDQHLPRIRRDRSLLLPMQCVAGDVHRADIYYRREDRSLATPRLIAWMDLATNRVFVTVIFFEKAKDVTREHVIGSFIEMTQAWGMPSRLYLDNGSEYGWTDFIADALKCAALTGHEMKIGADHGGVTRARPYNAPAKVIESIFASLECGYFPAIPGYVGGDRMRSKVANVGKAPVPFPGSIDELRQHFATAVDRYNLTPLTSGHLKGKSPRQAYEDHIGAGWKMTTIDPHALEAVFADDATPKVERGRIRVRGIDYYADELLDFSGQTVWVRIPKVGDRNRLAVLDDAGHVLFFVQKDTVFAFTDQSGAREQGRRIRVMNESVAALRARTKPVDLVAEMERMNTLQPAALVAPVGGRVTFSEAVNAQAEARRALPPPERAIDHGSEKQRRQYAALIGERPRKRVADGQ